MAVVDFQRLAKSLKREKSPYFQSLMLHAAMRFFDETIKHTYPKGMTLRVRVPGNFEDIEVFVSGTVSQFQFPTEDKITQGLLLNVDLADVDKFHPAMRYVNTGEPMIAVPLSEILTDPKYIPRKHILELLNRTKQEELSRTRQDE